MKTPGVIILRTAGCNCDLETAYAFEQAGARTELVHINQIVRGEKKLSSYQILAIPGGFTYGDDVSAGKILANELKFKLTDQMQQFCADGKGILGICNGFQVLVKAGMLPEIQLEQSRQRVTLTFNDSGKFEDRWVYLKTESNNRCIFTRNLPEIIYLPVAHSEGKFIAENAEMLVELRNNDQIVLTYVNALGEPDGYPWNPNGSVANIAGICDRTGRIFGLMPHPERYIEATQHPRWTREGLADSPDGAFIFKNAVQYIRDAL
ncbi:phosphoribosylformylglycinamidine synthase I [candidate division KSB1 bacterium]|nr:phosphoribosylformylglycinamidine synthase I [candidate division KSB1 bacterium]